MQHDDERSPGRPSQDDAQPDEAPAAVAGSEPAGDGEATQPTIHPDELHVPDEVSPWLKRFVIVNAVLRLGIPIVAFFTIVGPLVFRIANEGATDEIYLLTLVRPSKDSVLWGGALWRTTTGEVDALALFAAYAPLMIIMNWPFLWLGRAYGPALARGEGPRWLQRSVSPENLAIARTLLARKGPTIAILGRIAALPPTVMAAAAGTSDVSAWRYTVADTVGGVVAWFVTVGIGVALGEAWESAGLWTTLGGLVLVFIGITWMTNWLQREATRDDELSALTHDD